MSSHLPPMALTRWLLKRSRVDHRGFTLIELLVAVVVGSLIVGSLLYLVVELLGTNVREEKLTQAQQDTKRALDYISRDAREAVYVYSTPTAVVAQLTDIPAGTPVLAFWRLNPIDVRALPTTCSGTTKEECETLKVRQNVYDLVVYLHRDNTDNPLWSGPRRIIRYELTNYSNLSNLTPKSGYSDPTKPDNSFPEWRKDGTENTAGTSVVLTDFIDNHAGGVTVNCPAGLRRSPATNSDNFFVCIRDSVISGNTLNQSLYVFLRGSIADTGGTAVIFGPRSQASRLPVLNTEVQVRGVIEKNN